MRNPVVCDASKVSLYKNKTTMCLPAREEQVGICHNQIFTKINCYSQHFSDATRKLSKS